MTCQISSKSCPIVPWFFILVSVLSGMLDTTGLIAAEPKAIVKILAQDSFGAPFGQVRVTHFKNGAGTDFAARFSGPFGHDIPLGEYFVAIETESGGTVSQRVVVSRLDSLLILAKNPLTVEYAPGKAPVLMGRIPALLGPTTGLAWAKICGLYMSGCEVGEINADGVFSFINIIPGSYTVSVLGIPDAIMTERADIRWPNSTLVLHPDRVGRERVEVIEPK